LLLLESRAFRGQVTQAPGNSKAFRPVAAVVEDLSCGAADQIAAWLTPTGRIKPLDGCQNANAGLLEEIVEVLASFVGLSACGEVGQPEMFKQRLIAFGCDWIKTAMGFVTLTNDFANGSVHGETSVPHSLSLAGFAGCTPRWLDSALRCPPVRYWI
jgi:hypothetical protein